MRFNSSRQLEAFFSNFPSIFKNIDVCRNYIGESIKNYAEENDLLKNPQRMLISSFKLKNDPVITRLLNFYLSLGLQSTKFYGFVEYNLGSVSTTLFNLLLMLDEKKTRIHTLEMLLRP